MSSLIRRYEKDEHTCMTKEDMHRCVSCPHPMKFQFGAAVGDEMEWTGEDLATGDLVCHAKLLKLYSGLQGAIGGYQAKKFVLFCIMK